VRVSKWWQNFEKVTIINTVVFSLSPSHLSVGFPEYSLTEEFCRKHFLTGLLLRELGLALQEEQDLRHLALSCLKNLMAKHSLDSRYAVKVGLDNDSTSNIELLCTFLWMFLNCIVCVCVCVGETGTDSHSVPASVWSDPWQHASLFPPRSLSNLPDG